MKKKILVSFINKNVKKLLFCYKNLTFLYKVPENISNEIQQSIKWLEENLAPWQLVLQHWSVTFNVRRKDLDNYEEKTLCKFLNKWPVLKHSEGYQLIVQDFEKMNLTKLNFNIWQQFMDVIMKYSTYNAKDDEVHLLLEKVRNEDISTGNYLLFFLLTLGYRNIEPFLNFDIRLSRSIKDQEKQIIVTVIWATYSGRELSC